MGALKDGKFHSTFTVMGGFMQPQGHVQVLLNMILYNMDPQQSLDSSRFCIGSGHTGSVGSVKLEDGIADEVIEALKAKGHDVSKITGHDRSIFGRGQIIALVNQVLVAGSDGRSDGCAMGY